MNTSAKAAPFDQYTMWVELTDDRTICVPRAWFPRILNSTPDQREHYRIGYDGEGLHWEEIDEDISVEGLLARRSDQNSPYRRLMSGLKTRKL
ncbi:hypothetical protein CKO38_07135 [Rhodospirillum rubrum]|nr:DUF2442 domain-containing protein [Rhodospirillum rubrum]MBK1664223.1 hypothetical protein [Rhodospirillum rubrum]MBK1676449.1 hypothetical protein [Rhodospirillum rubrum]